MSVTLKHSARIVVNHVDWQRSIRCRIITKSLVLFLAAFLLSAPAIAAEKPSAPCGPMASPQKVSSPEKPKAMHYRSSAMALSMALGLRSATGPMVQANQKRPSAAMAKASPSTMKAVTRPSGKQTGSALARLNTGRCVTLSSLE